VRKTKEDASWRNKKVFLNGSAAKNRIPGCLLSRDESRKHGNEYIQERAGPGKVPGICRRGGETIGKPRKKDTVILSSPSNEKVENPSDDVVGGVVLGRVEFVNWVKKTFLSKDSNSKEIPQLKILKRRPPPDDLIQAVSDEFGWRDGTHPAEREKEEFSPGCGDLSLQGFDGRNQRRPGPAVRYLRSWNRGWA
jgi:hypothetical protein